MENKSRCSNEKDMESDLKVGTLPHPPNARRVINSLTSIIKLKLQKDCKSPENVIDIHHKLLTLQQYYRLTRGSQTSFKMGRLKLLLTKYIEREHDVLYQDVVDIRQENETHNRILKIMEGFLAQFNHKLSFQSSRKEQEMSIKTKMVKLLRCVQPSYFAKYKLLQSVALRVIENFQQRNSYNAAVHQIQSYVTTSDYGTDESDSDVERDNIHTWNTNQTYPFSLEVEKRNNVLETDDCVIISSNAKSQKIVEKEQPVVTFEILDDDDDEVENGENNYMVYMHREVQSKRNFKKSNPQVVLPVVTVSSDSEDEYSSNNLEKNYESGPLSTKGLRTSCKNINLPIVARQHDNHKTNSINLERRINNCTSFGKSDEEPQRIFGSDKDRILSQNKGEIENIQEDSNFLVIQYNETFYNELNSTIDPTLLFKESGREILDKLDYDDIRSDSSLFVDSSSSSDTYAPLLENDVNRSIDSLNLQSCRINDSLLEEFLLDDSYLLLGRKELEEFEYFLFNDHQSSGLSNLSLDCGESHLKNSDLFNKDIESIEAALDETNFDDVSSSLSPPPKVQQLCVHKLPDEQGKRKLLDLQSSCESQNKKVCENVMLEGFSDAIR